MNEQQTSQGDRALGRHRVWRAAVEDLGREEAAPHDLAQRGVLEVGQARTVLGLWQEQVPQPLALRPE
jgi:hypothetical protein